MVLSELHNCDSVLTIFYGSAHSRDLHSFPTRRSSDLSQAPGVPRGVARSVVNVAITVFMAGRNCATRRALARRPGQAPPAARRSEEHTSELQSLRQLVCRLPL